MSEICEICTASENLSEYNVSGELNATLCKECLGAVNFEIENPAKFECLQTSMWSENDAVKVLSYQILNALKSESFAQDLLEILYIDDELKALAKEPPSKASATFDSNGAELKFGDSVTIIKDLEVKGAGFTAKRGTLVKNIVLTDNNEQIEGRVNGVKIVLLTKFLKKVSE